MRRVVLVLLLVVGCGREGKTPADRRAEARRSTTTATTAATTTAATTTRAPWSGGLQPAGAPNPAYSTPTRCAGDGDYDKAVECFRIARRLRFTLSDAKDRMTGEMNRPTPGLESVKLDGSDGPWTAETKPQGVVWTHYGQPARIVPPMMIRLYQRLTLFPDPQKREGWPQRLDTETNVGGVETIHYHYTNANNGESNDVWVSPAAGEIVRFRTGTQMVDVTASRAAPAAR